MGVSECDCTGVQMSWPGMECIRETHARVMSRASKGSPPDLDDNEMGDPLIQVFIHMRHVLSDSADILRGKIAKCDGISFVGMGYESVLRDVLLYTKSVVSIVTGIDDPSWAEVCATVLEALATRTHGFFGHALWSLYSSCVFSVHQPVETQDDATWVLLRSIMSVAEEDAVEAAALLASRAPKSLAACGLLAVLVRTPAASAILASGPKNQHGLGPVFEALYNTAEPHRQRSVIDIVMSTSSGSTEFASHEVLSQLAIIATGWYNGDRHDSTSYDFVHEATMESKRRSIHRMMRSECRLHSRDWMKTSSELALRNNDSVWVSLWHNANHVLQMARRVVERRGCRSVVVCWFYNDNKLVSVARGLSSRPRNSMNAWASTCADEFEHQVRLQCESSGVFPCVPSTRMGVKAACALSSNESRWHCATLDGDTRSYELMQRVVYARNNEAALFCLGQGAFRNGFSFAVLSFKM